MKKFFEMVGGGIRSYVKTTDKLLMLLVIASSTISCLLLYSLIPEMIGTKTLVTQAGATLVGIAAMIIISLFDYHTLANLWKLHAPLTVLLTLLCFTPLGRMRGGDGMGSDDKNWLNIGFMDIQPSEFLKLSFILTFSLHCFTVRKDLNKPKNVLLLLLHGAVPIGLIFKQGDWGTMLIFVFIFVCILFAAGLNWKYILAGLAAAGAAFPLAWKFIIPTYLKNRFYVAWNPENYRLSEGMQQYLGRITLGSGQLFGKGLNSDKLLTNTPELYNDMMFAHIGQVFGFVGCVGVALVLTIICAKLLLNARKAEDQLGTYICVGCFAVVFFQSVINIGMVLCVVPVIGITLPFYSAGGSSVLAMYMCMGLALSVHNNSRKNYMF